MLDSERSETKSENEKEVAADQSSKLNVNNKIKVDESSEVGTPSLSSASPGKPGGENGVAEKDEDVNTTNKINGARENNTTANGSAEAMDVDNDDMAVKKEEDVEMKDAETEKSNKNHKNNNGSEEDKNGKVKDKPTTHQSAPSLRHGDISSPGSPRSGLAS